MVMISERPAEVEDGAVPGHWEGDLLIGRRNQSQITTLVERSTRFVMLAALKDRTAVHVADVLAERIGTLPEQLRRSLTWDQGRELSEHKAFSIRSGVNVYSAIRGPRGSAGPTRTPRACCASTSPVAWTSPPAPRPSSTRSPISSTAAPAKRSRGEPARRCSNCSTRTRVNRLRPPRTAARDHRQAVASPTDGTDQALTHKTDNTTTAKIPDVALTV